MKELTEEERQDIIRLLSYRLDGQNDEGHVLMTKRIARHLLSLLSKDQIMTKEEMNQAIEEAKNEDSSPEITSAFEPVGAEEWLIAQKFKKTIKGPEGNEIEPSFQWITVVGLLQEYASAVAAKMARENEELIKTLDGLVSDVSSLLSDEGIEWQQAGYFNEAKRILQELKNKLK